MVQKKAMFSLIPIFKGLMMGIIHVFTGFSYIPAELPSISVGNETDP